MASSTPIEVIIGAHNAAAYLAETLHSVLAQGEHVSVLLVDDGSSDRTGEIARSFEATGRVRYFYQPNSGGPSSPRNVALAYASAPLIAFFDADDLMLPGHLERAAALLAANPTWLGVTSDFVNFDEKGDYLLTHFKSCRRLQTLLGDNNTIALPALEVHRILAQENFFITGAGVYRLHAVRAGGGFALDLPASEDFDFFWRLLKSGPVGICPGLAFRRRLHSTNLSLDVARILTNKVCSRERLMAEEKDSIVRGALRDFIARVESDLAAYWLPRQFSHGCALLWSATLRGLPVGLLPINGLKMLCKCLLGASEEARGLGRAAILSRIESAGAKSS
jgi:glycosyltransferase involved in cell wall biosynthesis